jgi:chromosome segregation ATPase
MCPFCGAEKAKMPDQITQTFPEFFAFSCQTNGCSDKISELDRSSTCYEAEIATLRKQIDSLLCQKLDWRVDRATLSTALAQVKARLEEVEYNCAFFKGRMVEAEKLLQACREVKTRIDAIHPDGLPAKYSECYWGMEQVFSEINALDQGQGPEEE